MVEALSPGKPRMQYYFVVTQFHGKEFYRVDNLEMKQITHHSDGTERFPPPLKIIPIPECVALIPLDVLIMIYLQQFPSELIYHGAWDFKDQSVHKLRYNIARVRLSQPLDA